MLTLDDACEQMAEQAAEIKRLRDLLNKTAANNRTLARELRRLKHTDGEQ